VRCSGFTKVRILEIGPTVNFATRASTILSFDFSKHLSTSNIPDENFARIVSTYEECPIKA
jgi:hypothetical protein